MTTEYGDSSDPEVFEENDAPSLVGSGSGKLNAQNRLLAKKLHELGYIYALYGALDGLSLSYSMIKYSFDMLCTTSDALSSDVMHEWMLTPTGIAAITTESFILIGFSIIANVFSDDKTNDTSNNASFKRFLAVTWPYCRDSMKGLKNAYKGVRSAMQVAGTFSGVDLRYMIVPVGLVLGILAALNRMWVRSMIADRKEMMKANAKLLLRIQDLEAIDETEVRELLAGIQRQDSSLRTRALLAASYGGVVDGLYLFMGAMGVAALSPQVYLAMTVFSVIFTLTCVATRVYEEYDFQRRLLGTQTKVELAICGKQLEELFGRLQTIFAETATQPGLLPMAATLTIQQETAFSALEAKMQKFEALRLSLRGHLTLSHTSAALAGLRDGLAASSAIFSLMFAIATIYALLLTPLPAAFLVASILTAMTCLLGFMAHSLIKNHWHQRQYEEATARPDERLVNLLETLKDNQQEVKNLQPTVVKEAILGGMVVDPLPQFFFQEWFEVVRSFFSGVAKGQKSVDYTLNPLQEADESGHYHDSSFMLTITVFSSFIYAIGLALRAYARGFGRDPIDAVQPIHARSTDENTSDLEMTPNNGLSLPGGICLGVDNISNHCAGGSIAVTIRSATLRGTAEVAVDPPSPPPCSFENASSLEMTPTSRPSVPDSIWQGVDDTSGNHCARGAITVTITSATFRGAAEPDGDPPSPPPCSSNSQSPRTLASLISSSGFYSPRNINSSLGRRARSLPNIKAMETLVEVTH